MHSDALLVLLHLPICCQHYMLICLRFSVNVRWICVVAGSKGLPGFPGYTGPAGPKGDVGRDGRPGGPGRRVSVHLPLLPGCHPCLWIVPSYAYLYHCMTVQELKLCPVISQEFAKITTHYHHHTTSVLRPFFRDWVSWCQKRTSGLYGARED